MKTLHSECLPPEIIDLVISHLEHDASSLRSCGLVSRSWMACSRRYLFRAVQIHPRNIGGFADLVRHPNSTLAPFVRGIKLVKQVMDISYSAQLLPTLGPLARVSSLHIVKCNWVDVQAPIRLSVIHAFIDLTSLRLQDIEFTSIFEAISIICACENLEDLLLSRVLWPAPPISHFRLLGSKLLPPSLRRLYLDEFRMRDFMYWLFSHKDIHIVHHLAATNLRLQDTEAVCNYLLILGTRLKSLRFGFHTDLVDEVSSGGYSDKEFTLDAQILERCTYSLCPNANQCDALGLLTGLDEFVLDNYVYLADPKQTCAVRWGPRVLRSFAALGLSRVVLGFTLDRVGQLDTHPIDWEEVDQTFQSSAYANLKELHVRLEGAAKRDALASLLAMRLPRCDRRGIITVS